MSNQKYVGVWPVMLTPFDERKEIDWASLEKLVEWYLAAGVHGLFADCQSSEMFFLSDDEARKLVRFIVEKVDGRVPVVASGHTATAFDHQREQVAGMAETGVDGVIFISNRLAQAGESDEAALEALKQLTVAVPERVDLGIYECPYPYKRLLSDDTVLMVRAERALRVYQGYLLRYQYHQASAGAVRRQSAALGERQQPDAAGVVSGRLSCV